MPRVPSPAFRLDLWSAPAPAGGSRVAFLADAGGRAVSAITRIRSIEPGQSRLTFELHAEAAAVAELAPQARVVRLTRFVPTAPDTVTARVEEWRVTKRTRAVRRSEGPLQITCVPLEEDLLDCDLHRSVDTSGLPVWGYRVVDRAPADVVADVRARLAALGYTWVVVGTVTPTAPASIELAQDATPRAILDALVAALRAQGVDAEAQLVLQADLSEYRLELVTRIAGSLAPLQVRTDTLALELQRDEDALEQANVVVPFGADGADLREFQFEIAAIDAGTGWLTIQPLGGGTAPIIAIDDQFGGTPAVPVLGTVRLFRERTGRVFSVIDSSASPMRVRLGPSDLVTGIAVGERVALRVGEPNFGTRRAFANRTYWAPWDVTAVFTSPPRVHTQPLFGGGAPIAVDDQFLDWSAERSSLRTVLPTGNFNADTGILTLNSAPAVAPVAGDWVWFQNGVDFPPGTVTAYNGGTREVTLVPRYAGTQLARTMAGVSTRLYRLFPFSPWIQSTSVTNGEIAVNTWSDTPVVGDVIEIIQRGRGNRFVELAHPAAVLATRRRVAALEVPTATGATNRLPNADLAAWAGASGDPPDGWTIADVVGTVTRSRETDALLTRYGGKSWRLQFATGASGVIYSPRIPIHPVPGAEQAAAAVALLFQTFSGNVPLVVTLYRISAAGVRVPLMEPIRIYPLDTTIATEDAFKPALDAWYDAVLPNAPLHALQFVEDDLQLAIERPAGATNPPCAVVLDAGMVLHREGLPANADGGVRWLFGCDADAMVVAANAALLDRAYPLRRFDGRLLDVWRLDALGYAPWELVPGRDVALTSPVLGDPVTVRLLATHEDLDDARVARVTLDRVRPNVGRLLAPGAPARATTPTVAPLPKQTLEPAVLSVRYVWDDDEYTIHWAGGPTVILRIDGGAPATPSASPIVVPRNPAGGPVKDYYFEATSDVPGDVQRDRVSVMPQPTVLATTPVISSITISNVFAPGDGGGEFDLDITVANMPGGTTYDYAADVLSGPPISSGSASDTGLAIGDFPVVDITGCALATGAELRVRVDAINGAVVIATKTVTVTV